MARNYSTRDFFRQMPNRLLARYFQERGLFAELDIAAMRETKIDPLFAAWLSLPDDQRGKMDAELQEISDLSSEKGFCAIRDEAEFYLRADVEALKAFVQMLGDLEGHCDRAMVTFLDYHDLWNGATRFFHADTLPYWRKRKGFPNVPASVHADGRNELAKRIRDYFHQVEGRGKNCTVDAFRRRDLDYFFAYPEDYSQKSIEWVNDEIDTRPHNPAFEVVYVYSQTDGTLDLNCRGSYKAVEPLQGMFAEAILKLPELPPDPEDARIYDLNQLRERNFQFTYDPASGIYSVAVKKIRFSSKVVSGDRITLEANTSSKADAIYDLIEKVGKSIPLKLYNVTQVEIGAKVTVEAKRPPRSENIRITYPNSCSLKYDDVDLRLREMLVASGIEPREQAGDLELSETETGEA
jgi:hypothetical protein